jgi:hypothetical protein
MGKFQEIAVLFGIVAIAVFWYRIPYVHKARLGLWGVYLMLDFIAAIAIIFISDLIKTIPENKIIGLFESHLMLIEMALIIVIFHKQKLVSSTIGWVIFGIFTVIWFLELSNLDWFNQTKIYNLQVTPTFGALVFIALCLIYLKGVYVNDKLIVTREPFFWFCIGIIIVQSFTCTSYFGEIIGLDEKSFAKIALALLNASAVIVAYICYITAFWKSKEWVCG